MVETHYRWDFVGLSTDTKPTPQTSEKVVDGSTFYCSDNSKLYVYCKDNWYERKALGGGGGTSYTAGTGIDIENDTISVDTDTIQEKLTAGTGIDITDNTISATGGGGSVFTKLTSADYDYPTNNPTSIAAWKLDAGLYYLDSNVYVSLNTGQNTHYGGFMVISGEVTDTRRLIWLSEADSGNKARWILYITDATTGNSVEYYQTLFRGDVVNTLTSTVTTLPLSAKQGKVLNDKIAGYNIGTFANAAYEDPDNPVSITTTQFNDLQSAIENQYNIFYAETDIDIYSKYNCGHIDLTKDSGANNQIDLYFPSGLTGMFEIVWNNGSPQVTFHNV